MKLDIILAQYLYEHKKLNLPGIGTFTLDDASVLMDENTKVKAPIEGIGFAVAFEPNAEESLIDFIRTYTGKMKPLAQADLESFIMLSQQFINIGKPLYLEGIGTIQKIKNNIEFIPGPATNVRIEPVSERQQESRSNNEAYAESAISEGSGGQRKMAIALGVLGTLALITFGGYYLYNKNSNPNTTATVKAEPENNITATAKDSTLLDTSSIKTQPDTLSQFKPAMNDNSTIVVDTNKIKKDTTSSLTAPKPIVAPPITGPDTTIAPAGGSYKFVIETTNNKARALSRTAKLKGYGYPILLSTADSVTFKLYLNISTTPTDTARIRDSLNGLFNLDTATKKLVRKTTIEKN